MNRELTPVIKDWLDRYSPDDKDLILEGANLYLRVTRNRILFNNISRAPLKFQRQLYYELNKIYQNRQKTALIEVTRKEVAEMMTKVDEIDRRLGIYSDNPIQIYQKGRRADHDSLPPEIQQLYVDNDQIRLKIREAHLRLRLISEDNSSCPDSDRYPLAKDIIRLDKIYRSNWYTYDHYGREDPNLADRLSRQAVRMINLNKHRLKDCDDPQLVQQMRLWFSRIVNPSPALEQEMISLGIHAEN